VPWSERAGDSKRHTNGSPGKWEKPGAGIPPRHNNADSVAGRAPRHNNADSVAGRAPRHNNADSVAGRAPRHNNADSVAGRAPRDGHGSERDADQRSLPPRHSDSEDLFEAQRADR